MENNLWRASVGRDYSRVGNPLTLSVTRPSKDKTESYDFLIDETTSNFNEVFKPKLEFFQEINRLQDEIKELNSIIKDGFKYFIKGD